MEAEQTPPRRLRFSRWQELRAKINPLYVTIAALLVIIIVLTALFLGIRQARKHEIADARTTADHLITLIDHGEAAKLHQAGDTSFRKQNSAASLQPLLNPISQIYHDSHPKVDNTTVHNSGGAKHVTFVYRYDRLKVPFYVRVSVTEPAHASRWQLSGLGGSPDKSEL